jgi:5-methylthioadenosine/S-adenosylhomocysteine deaminase
MPGAEPARRGGDPGRTAIAFVVRATWVVPVEPRGALEDHAVVVREGRIEALLPAADAAARFGSLEELVLENQVLMPGLVNAHTHAAMTLLRGADDDRAPRDWLELAAGATPQHIRQGAELACAEMLAGGVTCFNDVYPFPEAALDAALAAGMRSVLGLLVAPAASAYASDPDDYLRKGLALRDRARDEPLASFCIAPHPALELSETALRQCAALAAELDVVVHAEVQQGGLERLYRCSLLGPGFTAVHAAELTPPEIELLARHGASVVCCPSSGMKRASGSAPFAALAAAGVNIALGTDGAASNNRLDLFQEMRNAALLAKALAHDPRAFPAHAALRAATLGGARALGLETRIGSIEIGKEADLIAVDLGASGATAARDPVAHLVYAAGREDVSHAWVAGRPVLTQRKLQDPQNPQNG